MMGHRTTCALAALLVTGLTASCQPKAAEDPGEIETVEVVPGRTSVLTTAYDEVAPQRRGGFDGVLPSDFPAALPLYHPSSLTDFGDSEAERWVVLFSPDETQLVQQRLARELRRTGWTLVDGDANRGTYRRGSLRVVMSIRDARPGTEIQVEY